MSSIRGIRGAVKAKENTKEQIMASTQKLLLKMVEANQLQVTDIASIFLTATTDLNAEFPAYAVRELGWNMVPALCAQEMEVKGGMTGVIRILLHVNTTKSQERIKHLYLGETAKLRPDLCGGTNDDSGDEE